ncbi:hypothetical protein ACT7DH_17805 [Bacillus pacificus]
MMITDPIISYPSNSVDNSFTKFAVKFLATGTLVASWGLSNVSSVLNYTDRSSKEMENSYEGVIKYSNGNEIQINPSVENRKISHHLINDGIDYSVTNEIADIMFWTDTTKEAIVLKYQGPPLFEYEKQFTASNQCRIFRTRIGNEDFEYATWDEVEDIKHVFKFEKKVKSKVVHGGILYSFC